MSQAYCWRPIGPFRAGRVSAVVGDPHGRLIGYLGAAAGGVWKTADGGLSWENVTDGFLPTPAIGALALSSADPAIVYAGTGEANIRTDVAHGSGVYRSGDGGRTWEPRGLGDSRHLARLVVHPDDPNQVYAAALGHIYGPGGERGIYRTHDGGRTWEQALAAAGRTGGVDVVLDPDHPRVLYAALWDVRRAPYRLESGGPGSGLYRSDDAGATWVSLASRPGLPPGPWGRIGLARAAASPYLWAIVEAREGGLFRSADGGDSWHCVNRDAPLAIRPWYFSRLAAAGDTVYALNLQLWRSRDAGRTFEVLPTAHADHHDLWIDPRDPDHLISGHDGGAAISYDGGASWSSTLNQPTGQFYHATTDRQTPYRVYGAQQDNTTLCIPSRTAGAGITLADCYSVGGGESGAIAVRPDNPSVVYAGSNGSLLTRYNHATGEQRVITPWPEEVRGSAGRDLTYRFAWSFPVLLSSHDPHTLYVGANVVFRSRNEGQDWDVISPDLTRHDPETLGPSGGPITGDNGHAELYATLSSLAESPLDPRILWAGSDDGRIHVTHDGGRTWHDRTPPALPEWARINTVEPSPHDPATAYVAAHRYQVDDLTPYALHTQDAGLTWTSITDGIAADDFARVIRADPERPGLLFLGTESGVYFSRTDGAHWDRLQQNLPRVPIYDIALRDGDVVVATHGRSFWILDDVTALRDESWVEALSSPRVAPARPTPRGQARATFSFPARAQSGYASRDVAVVHWRREGGGVRVVDAGTNPPGGAAITYRLPAALHEGATLTIHDGDSALLQTWTGVDLPCGDGAQRLYWPMRYPGATPLPGAVLRGGSTQGPVALPGRYTVRLAAGGRMASATLQITSDGPGGTNPHGLAEQFRFHLRLVDTLSRVHETSALIRDIRDKLPRSEAAEALERLAHVEAAFVEPRARVPLDYLKFPPGLNVKLAALIGALDRADGPPTSGMRAVHAHLATLADQGLRDVWDVVDRYIRPQWPDLASRAICPGPATP